MHYSEISYLENGMWVDAIRPMLIEPDRGRFSNSGRIVADPDRTAFFGDYFRIAGHPTTNASDQSEFREESQLS